MEFEEERTGTWHAYGCKPTSPGRARSDHNPFSDLHKLACLRPAPAGGNARFADYLAIHFPDVAASIDRAEFGVLHLEVGALAVATRAAIAKRDWEIVSTHFAFVDAVLEAATGRELHDAIGISYLGNLFYNETALSYAKARTLMPKRLAKALEIIERHYEELMR